MGFVPEGGFILVTDDSTLRRQLDVDQKKLSKIAEILGIPKADRDKLVASTRSITIYRGAKRKRPAKKE
jgi:hypothetical protein